jgi:purine nucleoside permease
MAAIPIKAVIVTAFEPATGPVPGEFRYWRERERMHQELHFAYAILPLFLSEDGVLGIVAGVGASRAAASIMALGLDPRFDLSRAFWLITGVCGVDPARGSLASVVLPEYIVEGDLAHEIDTREIPPGWPDGFVALGKSAPYEQPRADRFDCGDNLLYHLNSELVGWAHNLARDTHLLDTPQIAERRRQFEPVATAHLPPRVLRGDEISSTTFWHGTLLSARARAWVEYQTDGRGTYAITAMEDAGTLQALTLLAAAGRIDLARVLIVRAVSNFDQQRPGITAAESLVESRVTTYSAYVPALENAHRVGHRVLQALLAAWPHSPA